MAQAQKSLGVVAIEGWNDSPTPEVTRFLEKLKQRFHQRGYIKANRPGLRLRELELLVRRGRNHYSHGDQKKALPLLREAIEQLRTPPVIPDENPELRAQQMEALIIASLSSTRLGDKKSARMYMEMLERSFSNDPISLDNFGREPIRFRAQVAARMAKRKRGHLSISTHPNARIYVDGARMGVGEARFRLQPGSYVLFSAIGDATSEALEVPLKPGGHKDVVLDIDQGARFAGRLARRYGVDKVLLLSVLGNQSIKGNLYVEGRVSHSARTPVDATPSELSDFVDEFLNNLVVSEDSLEKNVVDPSFLAFERAEKHRLEDRLQQERTVMKWSLLAGLSGAGLMAIGSLDDSHQGYWLISGVSILTVATGIFGGMAIAHFVD